MSDLISRQAAIDAIENTSFDDYGDYMMVRELIEDLPSAEPKTGKWEEICNDHISGRCSACGWEAYLYEDDVVGMPYCPNCGARMEVE